MLRMEGDGERGRKVQSRKREAFKGHIDNVSMSKPSSQSDSSFGDPVCPVGNAKTPIAIVIVDLKAMRAPFAKRMTQKILEISGEGTLECPLFTNCDPGPYARAICT